MDVHQIKYREKLAEYLIKNLTKRRMAASFAPTAAQAREEIIAMIPAGARSAAAAPCPWWRWGCGRRWPRNPA